MPATDSVPLLSLTAGDLMTRDLKTISAGMPLREAAQELARLGVHGAPVVDAVGQCVGILSVSDLARWTRQPAEPAAPPPRVCSFQKLIRDPGGHEAVACMLSPGVCPLQRLSERPDGRLIVTCADPRGVCTDWQVVDVDSLPADSVANYMTTEVVALSADTPIHRVATLLVNHSIHRVIVVDPQKRPIGVVTTYDILTALARVGPFAEGSRQ